MWLMGVDQILFLVCENTQVMKYIIPKNILKCHFFPLFLIFRYKGDGDPVDIIEIGSKVDVLLEKIENSVKKEIDDAFDFAERSPFPNKAEAHKGIYANK